MIKMMNYFNQFPQSFSPIVFFLFIVWALFWKGVALWRSANLSQRNWFIAILVLNTAGLLEIAYLFYFSKARMKLSDLKFWEFIQESMPKRRKA